MQHDWKHVIDVKVPAKPAGIWTLALDWIEAPATLKLEASKETWSYAPGVEKIGADGHSASALKDCIVASAPAGALVGKLGGSSASVSDTKPFPVGAVTIIQVDVSTGPLFLTINDALSGYGNNDGIITVSIWSRRQPAQPESKSQGSGQSIPGAAQTPCGEASRPKPLSSGEAAPSAQAATSGQLPAQPR